LQKMPEMKKVKLHVIASISWHHKKALQFYNDEHDMPDIQITKSRKSRRQKNDTKDQHRQRITEWEASLPHDVKIKLKDNSMTQVYYVERLLLISSQEIYECRIFHNRACIFQEDNDSSHDTRSLVNVTQSYKEDNWIDTLIHSSQSSNLNSSEVVWNVLKQWVRRRRYSNVKELKQVILKEWDQITMKEIRALIQEMPDRWKQMLETKGEVCKSSLL
jgi:hypothetical protein